jgi:hypothetical protein
MDPGYIFTGPLGVFINVTGSSTKNATNNQKWNW